MEPETNSLEGVVKLLTRRKRNDIAQLLRGARLELDVSNQYGSHLFSRLTTARIHAPIDDYERLRALPNSDRDEVLQTLCEIHPPRDHGIEITRLEFVVDTSDLQGDDAAENELMAAKAMQAGALPNTIAFISYSHKDRAYGAQAKSVLAEIGIEAFLAHDDLNVSDEWRARIIEELNRCDLFVPLLSASFLESKWAPQEVGFIVSRPKVMIAPISLDGTTPFGFISHVQSRRIKADGITRELLVDPLARRMPRKILPGMIRVASDAGSFRSAEKLIAPLVQYFPVLTPYEAEALAVAAVGNNQIWSAGRCRSEYLPALIQEQGKNLNPNTLRALKYQIEMDKWYDEEEEEGN